MIKWLTDNGIQCDDSLKKIELLPPYHPELNSIENIWGIFKGKIASKNIGQNMTIVDNLISVCLDEVDNDTWRKTCHHVEEVEEEYKKYFDLDIEFVINLETSDSDTEEYEDSSDEN
ncbi:unnamed protein product [Euphydryas editha]|uniref:Tc1-like transposase DDE domain-containing protein n=1 Tax=Euphydryas editha TaxID=104508 RepID=A0AAU9TPK5_EUPED|nr:unnamed protein product [Euphydryas editha]